MNRNLTENYDSDFCGNLPVHLINVIQSYGALIVVDKQTNNVLQVSENVSELLQLSLQEIVGSSIENYIASDSIATDRPGVPQVLKLKNRTFLGIYHDYPAYYIVELNVTTENYSGTSTFTDVYHELKTAMATMEAATSIKQIAKIAAQELKKVSGFDKVMIYRFDENWNGHVIAEEREPDMESYNGVTFPASDIPKQARELYLRNAYRFIPDRTYTPIKLYPVINPATNTFLDMSDCNVRGVSTVHLEYLKNMGVIASMSTRIIKDGKLWGLIACHHKTPMEMSYKLCTAFELLSGIISAKTSILETQEMNHFNANLSGIYTSLVEETYRSSNLINALLKEEISILQLFNADGAVISHNGGTSRVGSTPESHDIEDIILWLNTKHSENIYFTNNLPDEYDYANDFKDVASGMLAIPLNGSKHEYIIVFRPEVVQVINWGGDPGERIKFDADMKTYHPRHSFKIWQEQVTGLAEPWLNAEVEMAQNLKDFVKAFLNGKDYSY